MASVTKHASESSLNLCRFCLARVEQIKNLNAFITLLQDEALELASSSDQRAAQGNYIGDNSEDGDTQGFGKD